VQTPKEGSHLKVLEKFYIYKGTKKDSQFNSKHTVFPTAVSEIVIIFDQNHKFTLTLTVSETGVEKIKTHILCSTTFPENRAV
jgi:hypothetical protein